MRDKPLRGSVLITGASGGIGEAFATLLAAEDHALCLVARNESELNRVKGIISARHDVPVTALSIDLGEAQGCERLAGELAGLGFVPDVVINNAGFGLAGKAAELERQEQLKMIDLNIRALTDLTLRFLPGMLAHRRGGIINVASVAAFMPGPGMAVYFASKVYVLSFTDALAEELRGTGVHATSLCPGPVETGFQQRAGMRIGQHAGRVKPLSAAEVAAAGWTAFNKGERMMVPGFANKLAAYGGRSAPRRLILPFLRRMMNATKA